MFSFFFFANVKCPVQFCMDFESDRIISTKFDLCWNLKVKHYVFFIVNVENRLRWKIVSLVELLGWGGGAQGPPVICPTIEHFFRVPFCKLFTELKTCFCRFRNAFVIVKKTFFSEQLPFPFCLDNKRAVMRLRTCLFLFECL